MFTRTKEGKNYQFTAFFQYKIQKKYFALIRLKSYLCRLKKKKQFKLL